MLLCVFFLPVRWCSTLCSHCQSSEGTVLPSLKLTGSSNQEGPLLLWCQGHFGGGCARPARMRDRYTCASRSGTQTRVPLCVHALRACGKRQFTTHMCQIVHRYRCKQGCNTPHGQPPAPPGTPDTRMHPCTPPRRHERGKEEECVSVHLHVSSAHTHVHCATQDVKHDHHTPMTHKHHAGKPGVGEERREGQ